MTVWATVLPAGVTGAGPQRDELHPIRRADRSWIYEPNEVVALIVGGAVNGPVTARAFSMFKDGRSNPEVVVDTLQPARRIRELRAEYDQLVGSLTLDRAAADDLKSTVALTALNDGTTLATAVRWLSKPSTAAGSSRGVPTSTTTAR